MRLSNETLEVLTNFTKINSNLVIEPGNQLKTIADSKNVFAVADVSEEFPQEVGIYDLPQFVATLNLIDDPHIEFEDKVISIKDQNNLSSIRYFMADPSLLTRQSKPIKMPNAEVTFDIDNATINKLKKAAATLGHNILGIVGDQSGVSLTITDPQNKTANTYAIDTVAEIDANCKQFALYMPITLLNLIAGDYKVALSSKLIAQLSHATRPITYWVALDKNSSYERN